MLGACAGCLVGEGSAFWGNMFRSSGAWLQHISTKGAWHWMLGVWQNKLGVWHAMLGVRHRKLVVFMALSKVCCGQLKDLVET